MDHAVLQKIVLSSFGSYLLNFSMHFLMVVLMIAGLEN